MEDDCKSRSSFLQLELDVKGDVKKPDDSDRESALDLMKLKVEAPQSRYKSAGKSILATKGERSTKAGANVQFAEPTAVSPSNSRSSSSSVGGKAASGAGSGSSSRSSSFGSSADEIPTQAPRLEDIADVQLAEEPEAEGNQAEGLSGDIEGAGQEDRGHTGARGSYLGSSAALPRRLSAELTAKRASADLSAKRGSVDTSKRGSVDTSKRASVDASKRGSIDTSPRKGSKEASDKRASLADASAKRASFEASAKRGSADASAKRGSTDGSHPTLTQDRLKAFNQGQATSFTSHRASLESIGSRRDSVLSLDPEFTKDADASRRTVVPLSRRHISIASVNAPLRRSRKSIATLCEVGKLPAGSAFGEVALQNDQPRSATIKTNENCYFAVLTREDYRKTLHETVENQKRQRMEFIQKVPLLSGLSEAKYAKITAMMQHREVKKNEVICGPDSAVLLVYIVHEGEFAVVSSSGDRGGAGEEEEGEHEVGLLPDAGSTSYMKRDGRTPITSLVVAPQIFGLTAYLRSEKRYRERVVCHSASGSVYCILAKELVSHLPRDLRSRLLEGAWAQKRFYETRAAVLYGLLPQPLGRYKGAQRRWREEETFNDRLNRATGKASDHTLLSVYAPGDRLRLIGSVFQTPDEEEQAMADSSAESMAALKQTAGKTYHMATGNRATGALQSKLEISEPLEIEQNKACWWLEQVARSAKLDEEHFVWPPREIKVVDEEVGVLKVLSRMVGTHAVAGPRAEESEHTSPAPTVLDSAAKAALEESKMKELKMMRRFKKLKTLHYMGPRLQLRSPRSPTSSPARAATSLATQFRMDIAGSMGQLTHSVSAPNLHSGSATSSPSLATLCRNSSEPYLSRENMSVSPARWMNKDGSCQGDPDMEDADSFNVESYCPPPITWAPPDMRFVRLESDDNEEESITWKASGYEEIVLLLQREAEIEAQRRQEEIAAAREGLRAVRNQSTVMRASFTDQNSSLGLLRMKWGSSIMETGAVKEDAEKTATSLPQIADQAVEDRIAQLPAAARDMFSTDLLKGCGGKAPGVAENAAAAGTCSLPAVSLGQIYSHPSFDIPKRPAHHLGRGAAGTAAVNSPHDQGGPGGSGWCVATPLPEIKSTRGTKWNRVGFGRKPGIMTAR
mmetsp:Transcript_60027/g.109966  ORF Transcript_60027/g.109966 Transcript_60027/m.109966 type:complete len:1139 (+) Transcript_60027:1-3417(+)